MGCGRRPASVCADLGHRERTDHNQPHSKSAFFVSNDGNTTESRVPNSPPPGAALFSRADSGQLAFLNYPA
jgi:hypothetical protein